MKPILADLHLHTVLSACAEVEMIPPLIVRQALQAGLGMIAVTDHNACGNTASVIEAAQGTGLTVLPGMELQTREEVHLLCLFGALDAALAWQDEVWRRLPNAANREEFFGAQFVVDCDGRHLRTEERLLQTSAAIGLEEAIAMAHELGGLAIPAHIDRPSFSLLANLGMIPQDLAADALEVTTRFMKMRNAECGMRNGELDGRTLIVDGDAHRLSEIQNRTLFKLAEPTLEEIGKALRGEDGRKVVIMN